MKAVLKWSSFVFALLAVMFALYGFVAAIDMWGNYNVDSLALLLASMFFIGGGPVLVCIGAFRKNKSLLIIGASVFIFGILALFVGRAISLNHIQQ